MAASLADGAILDEVVVAGVGVLPVRISRCPAGWQVVFELRDPAVGDLTVVHKLVAPTSRDAKASVPRAAAYLLGMPLDDAPSFSV
jgi:hypothetical protein